MDTARRRFCPRVRGFVSANAWARRAFGRSILSCVHGMRAHSPSKTGVRNALKAHPTSQLQQREEPMQDHTPMFDRRTLLTATSALGLIGLPHISFAQQPSSPPSAKPLTAVLADFIARFDLKNAPPEAID